MTAERFDQRRESFNAALSSLRVAVAERETEFVRDATIQRFEFTYELAWKAMKLALEQADTDVRNPKDTLTAGIEQGLIFNPNLWSEIHRMRNLTVHTYDEQIARDVYEFVTQQAVAAFEQLAESLSTWKTDA